MKTGHRHTVNKEDNLGSDGCKEGTLIFSDGIVMKVWCFRQFGEGFSEGVPSGLSSEQKEIII